MWRGLTARAVRRPLVQTRGADTRVCRLDTRVEALFRLDAAFVGIRYWTTKNPRHVLPILLLRDLFSIYAAIRKYSGSYRSAEGQHRGDGRLAQEERPCRG